MSIERVLENVHVTVTRSRFLQLFTAFTRVLLAIAFIPPSIPKIRHLPFTILPDSNPVGHYFNALYQTGFYYEFIGWSQLIAAILLIIPRTSHIGALLFLPIVVNIAVLTCSVGFAGTWVLTIFMSLAALWLVAWEYDRLKPIIFHSRTESSKPLWLHFFLIPLFFAGGGAAMAIFGWIIGLGNLQDYLKIAGLLSAGGAVFGVVVALHYKFMQFGKLKESTEAL